jgi:hypothetical protein
MTNLVPKLDDSRSYIYCPTCRTQSNSEVELARDTYQFRCMFGHSWTYAAIQQMIQNGQVVEMVRTQIIEQPSPHAQAYKIFIVPSTWERFNQKYSGRVFITIGTMLDAMADESVIFIDGPEVKELRLRGLKTGKDILAMIQSAKELERENETLTKQLALLAPLLAAAGLQPATPIET